MSRHQQQPPPPQGYSNHHMYYSQQQPSGMSMAPPHASGSGTSGNYDGQGGSSGQGSMYPGNNTDARGHHHQLPHPHPHPHPHGHGHHPHQQHPGHIGNTNTNGWGGPPPPGYGPSGSASSSSGSGRDQPPGGYGYPGGGPSGSGSRTSPTAGPPSGSRNGPPPGNGWSSIHPSSTTGSGPSALSARERSIQITGGAVKLEDLVSPSIDRGGSSTSRGVRPPNFSSSTAQPPGGMTSVPLNTSGGGRPPTSAGAGGTSEPQSNQNNTAGGSGGSGSAGTNQQPGPSEFIKKLYKMLEEESVMYGRGLPPGQPRGDNAPRGSVGWGRGGTSFVVWDMNDFTTKILHSNFSSFVRQLNKYGFSKIKHVDEETGQIKENVWEFQHPSFQAGGQADLESIKRKAVVPKKTAGGAPGDDNNETSPAGGSAGMGGGNVSAGVGGGGNRSAGLSGEEALRLMEMENRVMGLEDRLNKALEEVHEARRREMGLTGLLREMIGHLSQLDRESGASPMGDVEPSPRIMYLYQLFEQVVQPYGTSGNQGASNLMPPPTGYGNQMRGPSGYQSSTAAQVSPATESSSASRNSNAGGPSPAGSMRTSTTQSHTRNPSGATINTGSFGGNNNFNSQQQQHQQQQSQQQQQQQQQNSNTGIDEDIIELPKHQQTLYNGEPIGMTPIFADTPAWLTENTTTSIPMYHRKSSDAATLQLMVEALASQNGGIRFDPILSADGTQDPLDTSPVTSSRHLSAGDASHLPIQIQQSPFGTLIIPNHGGSEPTGVFTAAERFAEDQSDHDTESLVSPSGEPGSGGPSVGGGGGGTKSKIKTGKGTAQGAAIKANVRDLAASDKSRRSTIIKPHWNKPPRILVVEDDLVYRQLSSKFLEKFGCITETVENAHGAILKMNQTKYDLVLMDIFFGPSMDGRKATSLIRQFDMYTPIISMTSNAQPRDVDSYLQSGMNDVLAKPFTKNGLFGILDKHLIHLKAIQLSGEIPRSVGLPPLSDNGVVQAVATGAQNWINAEPGMPNPLAGMGWSDETYQLVLSQFLATGMMPDISAIALGNHNSLELNNLNSNGNGNNNNNNTIGTNLVFGGVPDFSSRKRSLEILENEWSPHSADGIGGMGRGGHQMKRPKGSV